MKVRVVLLSVVVACCLAGVACGRSSRTAEACDAAGQAARRIAAVDHSDTLALQGAIIGAWADRSRFVLEGDSLAAMEFDSALRDSLKVYDPDMAREIFNTP